MADLSAIVADIAAEMASREDRGTVAQYIPELAGVDPARFGIAVALPAGPVHAAGDARVPFSIQSISKVFTLAIALGRHGEGLWRRVGREPSGDPFNSIVQLESERGRPRNPFINAGALAVTDALLEGRAPRDCMAEILDFVRMVAGDAAIHMDGAVARSERGAAHRNLALAHFMAAHHRLSNPPDRVLDVYVHHCAIAMSCVQLARAGLALGGCVGAAPALPAHRVRRICALMMTCGHYDASGDFAFRVGLPGKSGVGGGILMVMPGRASVAIWSPGLNAQGNSLLGTEAAERLTTRTGWSVFNPAARA